MMAGAAADKGTGERHTEGAPQSDGTLCCRCSGHLSAHIARRFRRRQATRPRMDWAKRRRGRLQAVLSFDGASDFAAAAFWNFARLLIPLYHAGPEIDRMVQNIDLCIRSSLAQLARSPTATHATGMVSRVFTSSSCPSSSWAYSCCATRHRPAMPAPRPSSRLPPRQQTRR